MRTKQLIKYFILLILVQGCFGIEFDYIVNNLYSEFILKYEFNEKHKDTSNKGEHLNVETDIKLPSSMFMLYDNQIKNHFKNYVSNMRNVMSLIFSYNQNTLMKKLKDITFLETPFDKGVFDPFDPKFREFETLALNFYRGGPLSSFNDYFRYIDDPNIPFHETANDLFILEPCCGQTTGLNNEATFRNIMTKFINEAATISKKCKIMFYEFFSYG